MREAQLTILSYQKGRSRESFTLDSQGRQVEQSAETRGGDFFRTFHYTILLRDWGGRYYTGVAAMLMLIGVFTGIYTHTDVSLKIFSRLDWIKNDSFSLTFMLSLAL